MAIHDAIVIVLCWFAFFVSMPIHLKFLGEKGFAKATKVLHHLFKNVGASRPRASLKSSRFLFTIEKIGAFAYNKGFAFPFPSLPIASQLLSRINKTQGFSSPRKFSQVSLSPVSKWGD